MCGTDTRSRELCSYVDLEERVGRDHPLRRIPEMVDAALAMLWRDFAALYTGSGRLSIAPADYRGEKRSDDTHESTTDPDAKLYRKGPGIEAKLYHIGHRRMENRSGLIVDTRVTCVFGHAERLAALDMIEPLADRPHAITLGADRGYDGADFVEELRNLDVWPHVAQNIRRRRLAIDRRTTRHPGYATSQRIRKRIGEAFRWIKTVAGPRKTKLRGLGKVDWVFAITAAAYNLVRLPKLLAGVP